MATNINFINSLGQGNTGIFIAKATCTDVDALAFLAAAGITDRTITNAVCSLVTGLKADGIWNKFTAIYPFVGGTANSHKWNLRDPRDVNAAYRLVFNGGWVHTSQGIQGNGVNTYADTNYSGSLGMMGFYTPSNNATAYGYNQAQDSCSEDGCYTYLQQRGYLASTSAQFTCCHWPSYSPGFYGEGLGQIGNTTGYKNGKKISDAHGGFYVLNLPLGAIRDLVYTEGGGIAYDYLYSFTSGIQSFSYFSNVELTLAESVNLYARVQAFQTTLGRQVADLPISDPDVFRYLNNAGFRDYATDSIQINALNNLAVELKAQNIWSKMTDIHPFLTNVRNIFSFSETFTNAYWIKTNVTLTANSITAPNNTLTATSFLETATSAKHQLYVSSGLTLTPEKYTTSIHLKKDSRDWAYIEMFNVVTSNSLYGYFNLATGTIGTVDSGAVATITDAGNGWYRCTLTRTMSSYNAGDICAIGSASADNTPIYSGVASATAMYIWGAQLDFGSTATTYQGIGGTSSGAIQNQYYSGNLKDINVYLGSFQGGWTFSRTGARGNGINAYLQSQRSFYNTFSSGNLHISVYSTVGVIPNRSMSLWGESLTFSPYNGTMQATFINTPFGMQTSLGGFNVNAAAMSNTKGLIMSSATAPINSGYKVYQNGVLKGSGSSGTGLPTRIMYNAYMDQSGVGIINYAPFEIALITTGQGLTQAEAAVFNTIITNYQTALSRQIDPNAVASVNTVAPLISGTPLVGQTLTSSTGTWTSATTPTFKYNWKRNGSYIGATSSTYVLTQNDFSQNITCEVVAISVDGISSPVNSSNSLFINQAATNIGSPIIYGTQQVASTLTATTGSWTGNPPITFGYQWKKNGSDIIGATSSTYVLVAGDAGASTTIQCVVTGTNSYGSSNANSNTLTNIAPAFPANTVTPVISGTQRVGQVLTTTNGTWTGINPVTFTYQWKKNGSNIGGSTSQTYLVVAGDLGAGTTIQCVVTGTNAYGNASANSNILTGIGAALPVVSDSNAQAFINATDISDTTQANAINNLVIGLKADNLWTSLDQIYPIVGGVPFSHKWNLKNPATNQLVFNGGLTHDATGITGNGSNGFINTDIFYSLSFGVYSRSSNPIGVFVGKQRYTAGYEDAYDYRFLILHPSYFIDHARGYIEFGTAPYNKYYSVSGGDGGANELKIYRNGVSVLASAPADQTPWATDVPYAMLAMTTRYFFEQNPSQYGEYQNSYSNANIAFAHFSTTALNATQNANLNTRITTFQQALGREANTFDTDAQAFINAAAITNLTQQNAINTLVVGLKADGLWARMKAIYPFVGGTASSHKFNLKDPRDLNAAFRLQFFGGVTHNANGMTGNGTNGYAFTGVYLTDGPSTLGIPRGDNHWGSYNRTLPTAPSTGNRTGMVDDNDPSKFFGWGITSNKWTIGGQNLHTLTGSSNAAPGFAMLFTEQASGQVYPQLWFNGTNMGFAGSAVTNNFNTLSSPTFYLGTLGITSGTPLFHNTNYAFVSLGGIVRTLTDIQNLYTRVQAFQTALGRQV